MKPFQFPEAYQALLKASTEQDTKEIPLLLSTTNFKNKPCLEIGAGPNARIAIKLLNSNQPPSHITCIDPFNTETINNLAKTRNLQTKLKAIKPNNETTLPFKDKEFNITYAGWIPSNLLKNPNYLNELIRVTKNHIIIIMPGPKGDIPKMRDLILNNNQDTKNESEQNKKQELKTLLTTHFKQQGFQVNTEKQTTLNLNFPKLETIFNTFHFFDFQNNLTIENQEKLKSFLEPKTHNFKDHLYIFHAWKE
jgi:ubiquinone/menaquinone biosynthesis C-methylase UbiE|tara:strand:- start:13915 stop:14667 length:753 start_codon:yes stop_codon:yes gene_type:complete